MSDLWNSLLANFSGITFIGAFAFIFVLQLSTILKNVGGRWILITAIIFSGVLIFSFERGNLIWITAVGIVSFLLNYRRDDLMGNLLSTIGLSIAIATKVYPAFFVLLLIFRRRWRLIGMVLGASCALGFLPLLFFEHSMFENSLQLLSNARVWEAGYFAACPPNLTAPAYVAAGLRVWGLPCPLLVKLLICGVKILGILAFIGAYFTNEEWKRWFLVASGLICLSNFSGYYTALYMLPAICGYFASRTPFARRDWLYMFAFVVILTPLQFGSIPIVRDSINPFLAALAMYFVAIMLLWDVCSPHFHRGFKEVSTDNFATSLRGGVPSTKERNPPPFQANGVRSPLLRAMA